MSLKEEIEMEDKKVKTEVKTEERVIVEKKYPGTLINANNITPKEGKKPMSVVDVVFKLFKFGTRKNVSKSYFGDFNAFPEDWQEYDKVNVVFDISDPTEIPRFIRVEKI